MKNTILFRLTAIILSSAIFISCSKDSALVPDGSLQTNGNKTSLSQKFAQPGSMRGTLSPAPLEAAITAYGSDGTAYQATASANGDFRLAGLPPGIYNLMIEYISFNPTGPDDKYSYMKMGGIRVSSGIETNLGTITVQ
jgi:hypothetical protein